MCESIFGSLWFYRSKIQVSWSFSLITLWGESESLLADQIKCLASSEPASVHLNLCSPSILQHCERTDRATSHRKNLKLTKSSIQFRLQISSTVP